MWQQAADYDPLRSAPVAWLLMICRSRALDALRRADKAISEPDPFDRADACVPQLPDLHDRLQVTRDHAALHAAISRLRPACRQLLGLAYFRGMTHAELVIHTGIPLGTIKSQLRRSLLNLRVALGRA